MLCHTYELHVFFGEFAAFMHVCFCPPSLLDLVILTSSLNSDHEAAACIPTSLDS